MEEAGEGDFLRGIERKKRTGDSQGDFLEKKRRERTEEVHARFRREEKLFGEQSRIASGGEIMVEKSRR